ncbi:hypothetical protein, variant [Aphanomyces invadans]|uniref:Leucine-rich repeat-containing N-terminal plant-type domain-containing protein n=1 Tax=Aphanomyces invadans TaxID=157072 RepID=A0A024UR03_9STRA|nr:hypothetical protein, variant [Aphanomyces invadans]ETW08038.1 hypothetical protein, variant [Aphanomyces invadans]|eukprot:XP_008864131.1 hypothetical protein, variant [Aphanomyces invadans]
MWLALHDACTIDALRARKLRNNSITASGLVSLPPSINYLDLSNNAIDRMQQTTTFNWTRLPALATLILTGNNMTAIDRPSFPQSLAVLDLTDNDIARFHVDAATWTQLTRPGFQLFLNMSRDAMARVPVWCSNSTSVTSRVVTNNVNAVVCIVHSKENSTRGPATPSSSFSSGFSVMTLVLNVVIGLAVMFLASFVGVKLMERQMTHVHSLETNRDTCTSSTADDAHPMQYRRSLSPRFYQTE